MVDVQQRALRAFEQQALAGLIGFIQGARHIHHQRLDAFRQRQRIVQDHLEVDCFGMEVILQHEVVVVQHLAQLGGEAFTEKNVLQAYRATRDLVFICWTDTASGGADLGITFRQFAGFIDRFVIGQNQRAGFGDLQAVIDIYPGLFQFVHFLEQCRRRQHHAVADVAHYMVAQDAGRNQVQHSFLAADH